MKGSLTKALAATGAGLVMILGFQNCSDFALQEQVLYQQGLFDSATNLDNAVLPKLLSSESIAAWSKPGNPHFIASSDFLARQVSLVVALDRSTTGKVLTFSGGMGSEEAYFWIAGGKIRAVHAAPTSASYSYLEANLPSQGDTMVLAASFGASPSDIALLVNGVVQSGEVVSVGTPGDFSFTAKNVVEAPSNGQIYEYVIFGMDESVLSKGELNSMSRYIANNNLIPNVVYDPSLLNEGKETPTVNPQFPAVKAMLDSKCLHCHATFANMTENKALSMGLVVKKNPAASKLFYRLKGSSGAGTANMPTDASLSVSEV